jgi:hypothetical protein
MRNKVAQSLFVNTIHFDIRCLDTCDTSALKHLHEGTITIHFIIPIAPNKEEIPTVIVMMQGLRQKLHLPVLTAIHTQLLY